MKKLKIAIIGAGFFGTTAAAILSRKYQIDLYENSSKILNGASRCNQFRFHLGFHYPNSTLTVKEIKRSKNDFLNFFGKKVFGSSENKYLVARTSKISLKKYEIFLKKNNLSYKKIKTLDENKFIEGSILSQEKILNYFKIEKIIKNKLLNKDINLKLNSEFKKKDIQKYYKVIVISYANNNRVLKNLGVDKIKKYKYELVEKLVVKLPKYYRKKSDVVIYGKYVCIDPYLGTKYHLLSDVELSKIEIIKSKFPSFKSVKKKFINKGIIKDKKNSIFNKAINRCQKYLPYLKNAKYVGSYYVVRAIKENSILNDDRVSELKVHNDKIISVMSGKWNNCVSLSKKLLSIL